MTTNNHNTNLSTLLRKLDSLGSPVDLSVTEEEAKVEIVLADASMFEMATGGAGCVFCGGIVNQTPRPIYCTQVELRMHWPDFPFDWLTDPQQRDSHAQYYKFPGRAGPEFPRDQVLNHFLVSSERCVLTPGVPHQGWLLAIGGFMPDNLGDRMRVDATFAITASNHVEYTADIFFVAERLAVGPKSRRRIGSLYDGTVSREFGPVAGDQIPSAPLPELTDVLRGAMGKCSGKSR